MTNILEMLCNTFTDAYLAYGYTKALHKRQSIVVGTVGSAKAWHRYTYNALTVVAQFVECLYANQ